MLIAREKEISALLDAAKKEDSQFIAVYGRRRVGKTYLIRETFQNAFTFQHAGLAGGTRSAQLGAFANSLVRFGLSSFKKPNSWMDAFELLKDLIEKSPMPKKIIFLDELSWMDTPRSDLLMALESFWNGWAGGRKDVVLIVCASATSWMMDKVIHNKGGLYNRLNLQIHLRPFALADCEEYLKANGIIMNRQQILEGYMIMGGIPFYWSFLRGDLSMAQNIDTLFFSDAAPLKNEFDYLYASLFKNPEPYLKIVTALGTKKAGMTRDEIIKAAGIEASGDLTKKLENLENSDFIRSYSAYGNKKKNTIYQLIDNFTLFHFKFLAGKPSDENYWTHQLDSNLRNAWCGLAFERVCLQHLPQMKQKLGISGVSTETHSWTHKADPEQGIKGSQIDLLIVRRDQVINLCEMKYSLAKYSLSKADDEALRRKMDDFLRATKTKYALRPTLVTTYGLDPGPYSGLIQSVITMEDLFRPLM